MSDLVSRLLAAIEETERLAQDATTRPGGHQWGIAPMPPYRWGDDERDTEVIAAGKPIARCDYERGGYLIASHIVHHDPQAVARRCAADREEVELHAIVWRDIGWLEWDEGEHAEMYEELPVCGLCVPKHSSFPTRADAPEGPCQTIRLRARAYGLSVEEETTQ